MGAIASALKSNSHFRLLTPPPILLTRLIATPAGVGAIASALKTNTHLTNLNLGDNGMMKEGVEALASMLQTNTKLLRLDCSKNAGLWGNDEMKVRSPPPVPFCIHQSLH